MRRILLILIFIFCTVAYLLPEYPTQARPMLTVPAGTPRPRKIPTPVSLATPIVDSLQWTVDGGGAVDSGLLGSRGGAGSGQSSMDEEKTSDDPQLSTINYQLSTTHSVRPIFAMQGEEVTFSVTVHYDEDAWKGEGDPPVAENVVVSQELPNSLDLIRVEDPQAVGYASGITPEGRTFFMFRWPELAPGERVTAEATLRVAQNAPSGAALSFLSATQASQSAPETSIIRLGTPPDELPDFEDW